MFNMYLYILLMWGLSFLTLILSMFLRGMKSSVMVEWGLLSFNSVMFELFILIDWISVIFTSFVIFISSFVMLYSISYMKEDKFGDRFVYLVLMFIVSMLMMILSPSLISILFGWDMLGLVSYCLVIYYQNYLAFNSGMVTVLFNRVGDVGLLMSIGLMLIYGSWNLFLILEDNVLIIMMVMLGAMTKSAQVPFSSWLPMAMAAPTPVSALVHSSTLVTAGVYLVIRFHELIMGSGMSSLLLFLSVITMVISGFMANYEMDFKKVIALSTLSQLGVMMMILGVGQSILGFFHLLTHAIFKSLLFMCAGVIIHLMKDSQDIRGFGGLKMSIPYTMMLFMVSSLALSGFPFMAGFYSKDFIIEMLYLYEVNLFLLLGIFVSLVLTVSYSVRLICSVFFGPLKFFSFYLQEDKVMTVSMVLLGGLSVCVGAMLGWLFFFDFSLVVLKGSLKSFTILVLILGVMSWWLNLLKVNIKKIVVLCLISMWFLSNTYVWLNKIFMNNVSDFLSKQEDLWLEQMGSEIVLGLKIIYVKFYYASFLVYYLVFLVVYVVLGLMVFGGA